MLQHILLLSFSALLIVSCLRAGIKWRKNYMDARRVGIPIVLSPVFPMAALWMASEPIITPFLLKIPVIKDQLWVRVCPRDWTWKQQHTVFEELGCDTFIIVSPFQNTIYTCDASAIHQITSRRTDFPKPVELYQIIDFYGRSVLTSEGPTWRRHRKITAPPFSEANNVLVWRESLFQAQSMLRQWTTPAVGESRGSTWDNISSDSMRLSLHVISRAGFDVRCLWPGVEREDVHAVSEGMMNTEIVPAGHSMSYIDAMATFLDRLAVNVFIPKQVSKWMPSDYVRRGTLARVEWGQYMNELYQRKVNAIHKYRSVPATTDLDPTRDLMGAMINSLGSPETPLKASPDKLDVSEILGNSFIFMLAGHETTANTITHALYLLAMNPGVQQTLKSEVKKLFQGRVITEWDYEHDFQPLSNSFVAAVMNETLRIITPVAMIPKSTYNQPDHELNLSDRGRVTIPRETHIGICAHAAHYNPKYWPSMNDAGTDLDEFKPERWLVKADSELAQPESDSNGASRLSLYRPPQGAFIPFSDGPRACLGRRFAIVEILAVLSVIFLGHSVELAVDEFADDAALSKMTPSEKQQVWQKARVHAEKCFKDGMSSMITIQLKHGKIPVRFVRHGEENFADL